MSPTPEPGRAGSRRRWRTLADVVGNGRDNVLLLRLLAAGLVLFAHCWALAWNPGREPDWFAWWTGRFTGTIAVDMFFFISGLLVTRSYALRHSLLDFARARLLRIFPALVVCVVLCAWVLGPIATSLPLAEYVAHPQPWRYTVGNALLIDMQWTLPGVFAGNHIPESVNGVLWTLPAEMRAYAYVAAFGVAGLLRSRALFAIVLLALVATGVFAREQVVLFAVAEHYEFAAYFAAGAACWMFREYVPVGWVPMAVLVAACALTQLTAAFAPLLAVSTAYFCLWFSYLPALNRIAPRGDYSYGLYLYGYPAQQIVVAFLPEAGPWPILVPSLALAMLFAFASWRLVEKPALRLRRTQPAHELTDKSRRQLASIA